MARIVGEIKSLVLNGICWKEVNLDDFISIMKKNCDRVYFETGLQIYRDKKDNVIGIRINKEV